MIDPPGALPEEPIRLLHLTDSHVTASATGKSGDSLADRVASVRGESTAEALARVVERAREDDAPDLLVHTGDVADDAAEDSYRRALDELSRIGGEILVVPGNHDDRAVLTASLAQPDEAVHVVDRNGWRVVLLDSTAPGEDHGRVDRSTLDLLADALHTDAHVVVAMHHAPLSPCDQPSCRVKAVANLLDVFDRSPRLRAVLSGHLHLAGELERGGVTYLMGPSTCIQLSHRHRPAEHGNEVTPIGARWVHLHPNGSVSNELVWVDRKGP